MSASASAIEIPAADVAVGSSTGVRPGFALERTMTATGLQHLRELARGGQLAASYPLVGGLLSSLDDTELARPASCSPGWTALRYSDWHPDVPTATIAMTGHGTLAPLVPALTAELARHGLLLRPVVGDFGSWLTELSDPASDLYQADPDLVLCVLDPRMILDELTVPWDVSDVERVLAAKHRLIAGVAARFAESARGTLVFNTLPLPSAISAQLVDHRSRARLGAAWRDAGSRLLRLATEVPSVLTIDLDPLIAEGIAAMDRR